MNLTHDKATSVVKKHSPGTDFYPVAKESRSAYDPITNAVESTLDKNVLLHEIAHARQHKRMGKLFPAIVAAGHVGPVLGAGLGTIQGLAKLTGKKLPILSKVALKKAIKGQPFMKRTAAKVAHTLHVPQAINALQSRISPTLLRDIKKVDKRIPQHLPKALAVTHLPLLGLEHDANSEAIGMGADRSTLRKKEMKHIIKTAVVNAPAFLFKRDQNGILHYAGWTPTKGAPDPVEVDLVNSGIQGQFLKGNPLPAGGNIATTPGWAEAMAKINAKAAKQAKKTGKKHQQFDPIPGAAPRTRLKKRTLGKFKPAYGSEMGGSFQDVAKTPFLRKWAGKARRGAATVGKSVIARPVGSALALAGTYGTFQAIKALNETLKQSNVSPHMPDIRTDVEMIPTYSLPVSEIPYALQYAAGLGGVEDIFRNLKNVKNIATATLVGFKKVLEAMSASSGPTKALIAFCLGVIGAELMGRKGGSSTPMPVVPQYPTIPLTTMPAQQAVRFSLDAALYDSYGGEVRQDYFIKAMLDKLPSISAKAWGKRFGKIGSYVKKHPWRTAIDAAFIAPVPFEVRNSIKANRQMNEWDDMHPELKQQAPPEGAWDNYQLQYASDGRILAKALAIHDIPAIVKKNKGIHIPKRWMVNTVNALGDSSASRLGATIGEATRNNIELKGLVAQRKAKRIPLDEYKKRARKVVLPIREKLETIWDGTSEVPQIQRLNEELKEVKRVRPTMEPNSENWAVSLPKQVQVKHLDVPNAKLKGLATKTDLTNMATKEDLEKLKPSKWSTGAKILAGAGGVGGSAGLVETGRRLGKGEERDRIRTQILDDVTKPKPKPFSIPLPFVKKAPLPAPAITTPAQYALTPKKAIAAAIASGAVFLAGQQLGKSQENSRIRRKIVDMEAM